MKRLGSLQRLTQLIFRNSGFNVTVQPSSAVGDTTFNLPLAEGGSTTILTNNSTATVTGKTVDVTANTYTNILNVNIGAAAAIAYSKLAALTANRAIQSGAGGFLEVSSVTSTELSYLSGVTDSIQSQLDSIRYGTDWKQSVRVATTAAGTLASDFENGDTIDGVVLATGDRILIKNQAAPEENGIYTVNASGAPTRALDADSSSEVTTGLTVTVSAGTANADSVWQLTTNDPITLGVTELTFVKIANFGDHGSLSGLSDDDHTQYALLAGRNGGQTLIGDTAASGSLLLQSTADVTKGFVRISDGSGFVQDKDTGNSISSILGTVFQSSDFIIASTPATNDAVPFCLAFSGAAATGAEAGYAASRGTFASPDYLQSGDRVFSHTGYAYDGTAYANRNVGSLRLETTELHSATVAGTRWSFRTVTTGGTSVAERLRIGGEGVQILNANLITDTDNTRDIGSGSVGFANGYINKLLLDSNSQTTTIAGSASASASVDYQLPPAGPAVSGYVLSSTTGGVMSWVSNASVSSYKADWTDVTFTAAAASFSNAGDNTIESTGHGLVNGQALYFTTTGTLPGGLSPNVIYYVVSATTDDFQVAATYGGSAIDLADVGTGNHTYNVTSYSATHGLGTQDLMVQVYDKDDGFQVEFDEVIRVSTTHVIINGTELPGGTGFRVMVMAV